ncbi:MAG: hypothetical protein OEZ02_13785 [Anaerolineae bacterium]|nr:hypothetical protein [Anaerolineae bacterium]
MGERNQEKMGWVGGWLGGFIWVLILSLVFLAKGMLLEAGIGLLITGSACFSILTFSPWRYPLSPYWRLMAPIYVLFLLALGWGIWAFGDPKQMGIQSWWSVFLLLPIMLPLWLVGTRRWEDDGS